MALEPVSDATPSLTTPDLASVLQAQLLGQSEPEPAAPVEVETPEPAAAAVETPEPNVETPAEVPANGKFPIEEEAAAATGTPPGKKDLVGLKIETLRGQINTEFKPKIAELEQTVAQREARILELEGAVTEMEDLRGFKSTYEKEMSVVELTRTEAYRTSVSEPLGKIADRAAEIADAYSMDVDKVYAAIEGKTESERRALLKEVTAGLDLDDDDKFELRQLIKDAQPLLMKKDELYSNADAALLELKATREKETASQALRRAEDRSSEADKLAPIYGRGIPFLDADYLKAAVANLKATDLDALPMDRRAHDFIAGDLIGKVKLAYMGLKDENESLLAELEAYRKSSPRVDGGFKANATGGGRHTDLASALMQGAGLG